MVCNQKGFSLVELMIAFIVIALIVLGVINGVSLIERTKVNNFIKELEHYERVVSLYTLSKRKVPGSSASGNYISQSAFWKELRAEGVIDGDPSDGSSPVHALGNSVNNTFFVFQMRYGERRPMVFCAKNIKREYALGIDQKIDDGDPTYLSGHVYVGYSVGMNVGYSPGYDSGQPFVDLCKEFIVSHKVW